MKFDTKDVIIGILLIIVVIVIFGRRMSFADALNAPGPSPAMAQPENDTSGMPSGAILTKDAQEACSTKYGSNWVDFSPTLCKKI